MPRSEYTSEKPDLFLYDNYREFLRDWFLWRKHQESGFTYRLFSHAMGFTSPNQLQLVINGKRNITTDTLECYADVLKFKKKEREYFALLVSFNQSKSMQEKSRHLASLAAFQTQRGHLLTPEQYRYLSHWHYPTVREMVALKDFCEDSDWIANRLGGEATSAGAQKIIANLLELGLLTRDAAGKLTPGAPYVSTGAEVASVAAFTYHEQTIGLALEKLRGVPSENRNVSALTFTIRQDDYAAIVEEVNAFRKHLIKHLLARDVQNQDEAVYQLNLQLFPVTQN